MVVFNQEQQPVLLIGIDIFDARPHYTRRAPVEFREFSIGYTSVL